MTDRSPSMIRFAPDHVLPPGRHLEEKLEELAMTQAELAERTGLSRKHVSQLVNAEATLSTDVAIRLERVIGMPAHLWTRLEASYRTWLTEQEQSEELTSQSALDWANQFPHSQLVQRGYLSEPTVPSDLVRGLLEFFGVASHQAWEPVMLERLESASYRKAAGTSKSEAMIATWLRVCERRAARIPTREYDRSRFLKVVQEARHTSVKQPEDWWPELVLRFAEAGVALVLEPEFPGGTQLNGASWWANPRTAVVALSGRRKYADGLYFTMLHECVHVLKHSKKQTFIDIMNGDLDVDSELEREADDLAAHLLIHPKEWLTVQTLPKNTSQPRLTAIAREIGIHPGILVGQLQAKAWSKGYGTGNGLKQKLDLSDAFWTEIPTPADSS